MPDIVISGFMDEAPVNGLREDFDVLHDPDLCTRPDELAATLAAGARALIVRNNTELTPTVDYGCF